MDAALLALSRPRSEVRVAKPDVDGDGRGAATSTSCRLDAPKRAPVDQAFAKQILASPMTLVYLSDMVPADAMAGVLGAPMTSKPPLMREYQSEGGRQDAIVTGQRLPDAVIVPSTTQLLTQRVAGAGGAAGPEP